jgi:hypothetical protein
MEKYHVIYNRDEKTKLVKMSFRNLLLYTDNWIYNRDINLERVEEIFKSIKDNSMCGWTLHAFEDDKKCIRLLDGQHRYEAIKRYLSEYDVYNTCNYELTIWIYLIPNEESNEDKLIDLFKIINSNKQINEYELPSKRKLELTKMISTDPILSKGIRNDSKTSTSNQPYIHLKEIKVIIDKILRDFPELSNEEILMNIKIINNRIRYLATEANFKLLFGKKEMLMKRLLVLHKCHEINFYLNIKESCYNRDIWIKFVKNPDLIK